MITACIICKRQFVTYPSRIRSGKGKYCSKQCKDKASVEIMSGEKNPKWKGVDVSNSALHSWIHRNLGFPDTCEHCGFKSDNHRKIHWANKSGKYKRDLTDWIRLCVPC